MLTDDERRTLQVFYSLRLGFPTDDADLEWFIRRGWWWLGGDNPKRQTWQFTDAGRAELERLRKKGRGG